MSIKVFAKQNNLYYENIAAYLNEVNQLGYTAQELDAPKHVIASAHSVDDQGQSITNTLGHLNELVAAYRGRDGFAEHNGSSKQHCRNDVGNLAGSNAGAKADIGGDYSCSRRPCRGKDDSVIQAQG